MDTHIVGLARRSRAGVLLILVGLVIAVAVLAVQANSVSSKRPLGPVEHSYVRGIDATGPAPIVKPGRGDEPSLAGVRSKKSG
jgi:hypothetical protein